MRKIRLFIAQNQLEIGKNIEIKDQDFHYLANVMRVKNDDEIEIFNGFDGDFLAKTAELTKKSLKLIIFKKIKEQEKNTNITLAFTPVKNVKNEFIAQKATELGAGKIQPIITQHSIVDKINEDRFKLSIKEACEQCERNSIPELLSVAKLDKFLSQKDLSEKILILCDESGNGKKASEILPKISQKNKEIVVLIGPEGGFSKEEFTRFYELNNLHSISLGQRILRADTAIISALALVNEFL